MAEPEARLLEQGFFSLYVSDGPGILHLVLSPEGDTHRLIALQRDGNCLRGRVMAVAGRFANVRAALPRASRTVAAGRYRLERLERLSRLDFIGEEMAPDLAPIPLTGGEGWSVRVCPPPGSLERRSLPAHLLARFDGVQDAALEQPDALDYVGMRLSLVPAETALVEAGGRISWRSRAAIGERWTG